MTLCWLKSPLQITFYHCPKTPKEVLALSDIVIIGYCDYYGFGCHSLSIRQAPHLCPARGRRWLWRPRCTLGRIPERKSTHSPAFPPSVRPSVRPSDVTRSDGRTDGRTDGESSILSRVSWRDLAVLHVPHSTSDFSFGNATLGSHGVCEP